MKIKLYLDSRKKDDDNPEKEYPIKIAINSKSESAYIPTGLSVQVNQWDIKGKEVKNHPQRVSLNIRLGEKKLSVERALAELQDAGELHGLSAKEIKDKVCSYLAKKEDDSRDTLLYGFQAYIRTKSRKGTIGVYESTLRKLNLYQHFSPQTKFSEITPGWLKNFESFLAETSPSANARGIHLRNIRTVFNFALSEGFTTASYPFRRFKIKKEPTGDRSIPVNELQSLATVECSPSLAKYRDIFLLSFFLCGMNLEDMIKLREIKSGRIETTRIKTGQPISIKVQPEAFDIINKYRGNNYLLNIINKCKNYKNYQRRINNALKRIGQSYNPTTKEWEGEPICQDISFYSARYSWATIAAELDIPEKTIGAALAHSTSKSVTSIYTRVDMRKKIDAANRKVIDFCFKKLDLQK